MKRGMIQFGLVLISSLSMAQAGHIMQGVGAINMSMGGAATAQPLDISGALQWNPAAISVFDHNELKFDVGFFFSAPEVSSSLPPGALDPGAPGVSGTTPDDRGMTPLPSLAFLWGKEGSRHTFAATAFGVSGFGVTFPEEANNPLNPAFNPNENSNPINYPQEAMGFGHIQSDYLLLQIGFTWAYELSDKFSIGLQPTLDYASLELMPNPTALPNQAGYPTSKGTSAIGFGGQIGLFFDSGSGIKAGASYKTVQSFGEFEFENTYLDNSTSTSKFKMNYPSIISVGLGYSKGDFDVAVDYRFVDYENTDGFSETGWEFTDVGGPQPVPSVKGFGWENISIISAGIQYKGIDKVPLRIGYTYSSNPISSEVAFFNVPATAIIKHAFQFGLSYVINDRVSIDGAYHHGLSGDATTGQLLSPAAITAENPLGALAGTSVSYEMTTDLILLGFSYRFMGKE